MNFSTILIENVVIILEILTAILASAGAFFINKRFGSKISLSLISGFITILSIIYFSFDNITSIEKNIIASHQQQASLTPNFQYSRHGQYNNILEDYFLIKIFYATDRKENNDIVNSNVSNRFLNDWSELKFGTAFVSIPIDHKMGNLEAPTWWRFEFTPDPNKHIVLNKINVYGKDNFFKELNDDVASSGDKEALVFVHGYNTTFEDAARRTAQISYDLDFKGPAILYSWPSQGQVHLYPQDEVNADRSAIHLETFLEEFSKVTSAKKIHLIAHSMGNRVLVNALSRFSNNKKTLKNPVFNQILLTAPDIDVEVFRDIANKIAKTAKRTTIYASNHDEALDLSLKFHGYPRVGDSKSHIFVTAGIDTIDASAVDTSLIGHSYYGDNRTVISDLYYAIRGIEPSGRHGLRKSQSSGNTYWVFQP